jgi:transposase
MSFVQACMLTREQFEIIYEQGPDAVFALLVALHEMMQAQIDALSARVQQLEARLGKDSHNSSKPPSSDGPGKKPQSLRKQTGKPSGAQPGHPGKTLSFVETPDQAICHRPVVCAACGGSLSAAEEIGCERRQVFELPPLRLVVTEHQALCCVCPHCHTTNRGAFPTDITQPVQYGPGVLSLCVYLMQYQLLPYARTRQLLFDLFGCAPCEGTLASALSTCHARLAPVEAAIKEAIVCAPVGHFDETGVRIGQRLLWLHTASTKTLTFYAHHGKRGRDALNAIGLLPRFAGTSVHDAWASYFGYACTHALCNAHLLRELIGLFEQTKQTWTQRMMALLLSLKRAKETAQEKGETALCTARLRRFAHTYHQIVARGLRQNPPPEATGKRGRPQKCAARNLLERLQTHGQAVLRFAFDFSVPFDNNLAERDLRMLKVRQKVSGCFRSEEGAAQFCRIRGYISTLRKQGRDVLTALQSVFRGSPIFPTLYA